MKHVRTLIVGAGVTGLAAASRLIEHGDADYLIVEAGQEIGGYCKSVVRDGFTWDYSGHFFHFRNPEIEARLRQHISCPVVTVQKKSYIDYRPSASLSCSTRHRIDFPFQKNIHQLDKEEFIECLVGLYDCHNSKPSSQDFLGMLYENYGRGIVDKFLKPYNQKLYACDLSALDADAMGRFFPHATFEQTMASVRHSLCREPNCNDHLNNASYNSTFTYPKGGAIEYVRSLAHGVDNVSLNDELKAIDLEGRLAYTSKSGVIKYDRLVSSAPLPRLLEATGLNHDPAAFSWNKVAVFNLGFDKKRERDVHWVYYPDPRLCFYRVGWYDNIFNDDRMSLYVEVGLRQDQEIADFTGFLHQKLMPDLREADVVGGDQRLVSWHAVVMDPAYVHMTRRGTEHAASCQQALTGSNVHSIGRYGGWTYCSIEDNIVEAFVLVDSWQHT